MGAGPRSPVLPLVSQEEFFLLSSSTPWSYLDLRDQKLSFGPFFCRDRIPSDFSGRKSAKIFGMETEKW